MPSEIKDLTGQRFNHLKVVGRSKKRDKKRNVYWDCICECGVHTTVRGDHLKRGGVKSCGCLHSNAVAKGERHPNWQGDDVGYTALHKWVTKHKPKPDNCELCRKPSSKLDAHNITGEYRRDICNFIYVCKPCHGAMHVRIRRLKAAA